MNEQLVRPFGGQPATPGYNTPVSTELGFAVNIAAGIGVETPYTLIIDQTYDFVWLAKSADAASWNWSVQIDLPGDVRQQPSGPVKGSLVFGLAPFSLPVDPGHRVRGGSRIVFHFINRTGGAIAVDVALYGWAYKAS